MLQAIQAYRSGLTPNNVTTTPLACWIGRVAGLEDAALPHHLEQWECRNNRLAWLALHQDDMLSALSQASHRYGKERIAIVIGTSTASIAASEEGYHSLCYDAQGPFFQPGSQNEKIHTPHAPGAFVQHVTGLTGPCVTISTACSSSAKAFAQASRLIQANIVDAALVGGVDTLCNSVLFGFNALQLLSTQPCRPFDVARDGLSIGEAGGFALLERSHGAQFSDLALLGYGESSDAYHMSSPHPDGLGARLAIQAALDRADLMPNAIDYINLHGTATPANDRVEAALVADLFPNTTYASSTKGWSGHTLGAAGIVEAVITMLSLRHDILPGTLHTTQLDPCCGPQIQYKNTIRHIRHAMSNSFGFGGNNCALLFGRTR